MTFCFKILRKMRKHDQVQRDFKLNATNKENTQMHSNRSTTHNSYEPLIFATSDTADSLKYAVLYTSNIVFFLNLIYFTYILRIFLFNNIVC